MGLLVALVVGAALWWGVLPLLGGGPPPAGPGPDGTAPAGNGSTPQVPVDAGGPIPGRQPALEDPAGAQAAVDLRVVGAPFESRAVLEVSISEAGGEPVVQERLPLSGGGLQARLPAPAGKDLLLSLGSRPGRLSAEQCVAIEPVPLRLRPGEVRPVTVDLQALPAVSIQLVGVSPALLPYLVIAAYVSSPLRGSVWYGLQVDSSGTVVLRGRVPDFLELRLLRVSPSSVPLQGEEDGALSWRPAAGDRIRVLPSRPVVGVRRAETAGRAPLLTTAFRPSGRHAATPVEVRVLRREVLESAAWLYVWSEDGGFRVRPADLMRVAEDLWLADPEAGERLATLRLRLAEGDVERAKRLRLHFTCEGEDSIDLTLWNERFWRGPVMHLDLLPAGTWRIEWRREVEPLAVLAEAVPLRPGEEKELEASVPALRHWMGRVVNWQDLPLPIRQRHLLTVDGVLARVAEDGSFEVDAAADVAPEDLELLFLPGAKQEGALHGRLLGYDLSANTLEVEHPPVPSYGEVRVRVEPALAGSEPAILVLLGTNPRAGRRSMSELSGDRLRVALRDGQAVLPRLQPGPLVGALVEKVGRLEQVTAWFSIPPGTEQAVIRGSGHQATLRVHRPAAFTMVYVEGPDDDQPLLPVAFLHERTDLPVWIAPGTRAVVVDRGGRKVDRLPPDGDLLQVW